jgi:hypothetical protein
MNQRLPLIIGGCIVLLLICCLGSAVIWFVFQNPIGQMLGISSSTNISIPTASAIASRTPSSSRQKAVPTSPARATGVPKVAATATQPGLGRILFQDNFSDSSSGWVETDLGDAQFKYDGGVYSIALTKGGLNSFSVLPKHAFDNVSIEADATLTAGPTNSIYGIICRATAGNVMQKAYEFLITADGGYGIIKVTGPNAGESNLLGQEGKSSAIHTGKATNHLRADCSASDLALYVNGSKLLSVTDNEFKQGQTGFAVSSPANSSGYTVHFDNFVVREATP